MLIIDDDDSLSSVKSCCSSVHGSRNSNSPDPDLKEKDFTSPEAGVIFSEDIRPLQILDLLEKTIRKEEEICTLQERITALETSTQLALEHLESVPEKLNLEDFRDFGNSHSQKEIIEKRYNKYKELVGSLQQHLEDLKHRLENFQDKKTKADFSAVHSVPSNQQTSSSFMTSSLLSTSESFTKSSVPLDLNAAKKDTISRTVNRKNLWTEKEKL
ncbi:centrosomal protein of 128 kDa-like [Python bivittatus]|uniref:Centrosomal protein of 128 kDa-like n=1 Tax=Python bivittatus TaxID=176946 RepID=A0A9F2R783_PYTBI|nr:centrosomal protein of 128 kDa-like [Python bivittatus]